MSMYGRHEPPLMHVNGASARSFDIKMSCNLHYVKYLGWITTRLKQALRAIQARTKPATA